MKENILKELQIQIESVIFQFENNYRNTNDNFENFIKANSQIFKEKIAKLTTDAIHKTIVNNLSKDKDFIAEIVNQNSESFENLIKRISNK
ncbi:hypothetical protein [Flavobacterium covae]|uniref:hypothetical protein n=1 Tax=Flavobacterium covae TaxID=2906076 RepID=UPI00339978D4